MESDKSGSLQKLVDEDAPNLPSVDTVALSLIKLIDESTREKDGGEFLYVDGTHLTW